MKKLLLKSLRDIKQSKGQFIAIIVVIAVGVLVSTGAFNISNSLSSYAEKYFKEHNLSDLYVYYNQISKDNISTLKKIDGINKIEGRYTVDGTQRSDNLKTQLKIHSIPINNEINTLAIVEGKTPSKKDDIILDSHYGKEHNYSIGDKIKIYVSDKEFEFIISGFCENVEHAFNIKDGSTAVPNHKTYGIAYISEEKIPEIAGASYYNELIIDVKENYDTEKLSELIEAESKDFTYLYKLTKERTISFSKIDAMIKSNKGSAIILPLVFFMVAAIIIFITMSRIINSQRSQIGIMKALGVKNKSIIFHYIGYSNIICIIGSVIGSILGIIIFHGLIISTMDKLYSFPNFKVEIDVTNIFYNLILSIIFGAMASYLSCRKILKECAAQAMRPKPLSRTKRIFVERLPIIWKKISYGNKIILRNIFLTKQRSICTSIGVIVCILLLIIGFGYKMSVTDMGMQINEIYKYDLRVDYKEEINFSTIKLPGNIEKKYALAEMPVEFSNHTKKKDTVLIVTEKDNDLIVNYDEKNNKIFLDDNGVVISKAYADKYNLSEGDSIGLKFLSPYLEGKSVDVKVSGISLQYLGQVIYCTPTYLKKVNLGYKPTTLLLKLNNSSDTTGAYDFFNSDSSVYKIMDKDDLIKLFNDSVEDNYPLMIIFVLSAIVFSATSIYIISSINIFERTRELATLKVLGYQKNKINKLIIIENIIITIFSIIIVLPLCGYFYKGFAKSLSAASTFTPENLNVNAIILSISITLLVTVISNLLLRKKVSKIDMIESLKSIE